MFKLPGLLRRIEQLFESRDQEGKTDGSQ
jgi:hypothetical protein